MRLFISILFLYLILFTSTGCAQVNSALRIDGAGLVSYNRITTSLGDVPVSVVYLRGDYWEQGQPYLWPNLEPRPGVYNFSPFLTALDEAHRKGLKVGLRIMTAHPHVPPDHQVYPFFPEWIRYKSVTRKGKTGYAPDWEDPDVQQSIRDLLLALGHAVRDHPAFLFADVGVLGWVGEWHTTVGFRNSDFMPSTRHQKKYVDFHIEAFGADKLLLHLVDMSPEILQYGLERGINGIRQDCFGSSYHMGEYDEKLEVVPALQRVIDTGMVFFEVCGGNMSDWTHQKGDRYGVTRSADQVFEVARRWKCTLFGNMGAAIPERYDRLYKQYHRDMMGYEKNRK